MQGSPKQPVYACKNRQCPAPASITARRLDPVFEAALFEWAGAIADTAVEVPLEQADRGELEARLAGARAGVEAYVTARENFGLEPAVFQAGLEARQELVDELELELAELGDQDEAALVRATLRQAWPILDNAERRRLLGIVLDRVEVKRGTAKGRARDLETVESRVRIVFRDAASE